MSLPYVGLGGIGAGIGPYRLLSRLAVGGMAEIFLALRESPASAPTLVTLKRILPELRDQEEFLVMFHDEARITASLDHPNIARVFELVTEGDDFFIAMEFIAGQSLTSVLRAAKKRNRPLPLGFAGTVAREVCSALHHAHGVRRSDGTPAPVIHRDVSPNNIMVTYAGEVKVIDFGVAKAKGSLSRTGSGMVKGSQGYMSPEQARGAPQDSRSDIFSTGAVLHEMLTGVPLFLRGSELQTFRSILRDEIVPPISINPGVPPRLSELVMKALVRDPSQRFATARELGEGIERAIPALLFDRARTSELMMELFEDPVHRTRSLLEMVSNGSQISALAAAAASLSQTTSAERDAAPRSAVVQGGRTQIFGPLPTGVMRAAEAPPPERPGRIEGPTATPAPTTGPTPASPATAAPAPTVEGATVLFVDDSQISRDFVEAHLESFGFPVLQCGSAEEALKMLDERLPDLILLDVRMPGIDGYTLCRLIRERCTRRPFLPILFLSATISFEERLKGLAAGGDDFVGKPYQPEELVALVRAHLQRTAFLQELARERAARARQKALAAGWKLPGPTASG